MGYSPYLKGENIRLGKWVHRIGVSKVNGALKVNPYFMKAKYYLQTTLLNTVKKWRNGNLQALYAPWFRTISNLVLIGMNAMCKLRHDCNYKQNVK